jgi:hypothetical protein
MHTAEELLEQFENLKEAIHIANVEKDNIAKEYFDVIDLHEGDIVDIKPFEHLQIMSMKLVNKEGLIRLICRHITTVMHLDTYIKDIKNIKHNN